MPQENICRGSVLMIDVLTPQTQNNTIEEKRISIVNVFKMTSIFFLARIT